jgi:hypothetical protein
MVPPLYGGMLSTIYSTMSGADKAVFDSMKESQQPEAESFSSRPLLMFLHFHRIFPHICRCVTLTIYIHRRQCTGIIDSVLLPSENFCGNFCVLHNAQVLRHPLPPSSPLLQTNTFSSMLGWQINAGKFSCRSIF